MEQRLFPVGVPASGRQLIGREKEEKELAHLLTSGQSVILISPRRFGKTSLVLSVLEKLKKQGVLTGHVDLFNVVDKQELAEKITLSVLGNSLRGHLVSQLKEGLLNLLKHFQLKGKVGEFEMALDLLKERGDEDSLLEKALHFTERFAKKHRKPFIFFLDEFSEITKLNGNVWLKKMRAIFQLQKHVTYVFAGSQESLMTKLFSDKKEAFYRFARFLKLRTLPEQATREYIESSFRRLSVTLTAEAVEEMISLTECHPYYVQLLCQTVYLLEKEAGHIEQESILRAKEAILVSEDQYFDTLWQNLKAKKHALSILLKVAEGESPYRLAKVDRQSVYYALKRMEEMAVVERKGEGIYHILDPFFRIYLLREKM